MKYLTDPYTVLTLLIFALFAGFIVGCWVVALAARARQLDDGARGGSAYRDLLDAAKRYADPAYLSVLLRDAANIWDRYRPDGLHLEVDWRRPAETELTPAYVHRIIDAYATGDPVDLSGCGVPPDVQGRLRAITIGASEATAALPHQPVRHSVTAVHATDVMHRWPLRTGHTDG